MNREEILWCLRRHEHLSETQILSRNSAFLRVADDHADSQSLESHIISKAIRLGVDLPKAVGTHHVDSINGRLQVLNNS
jgi:hypothetical protein